MNHLPEKTASRMRIEFREWDNSEGSRQIARSVARDSVQVWLSRLDHVERREAAKILSADEIARAAQFLVEPARDEYIGSRVLLRNLLGACLDLTPSRLSFRYSARGKPFLDAGTFGDLRFNLAHSAGLVVIAVTQGTDVGVDAESIDRRTDTTILAKRIFSSRQQNELQAMPLTMQREAFFNGWTRKEAYLKATGEGLTDELQAIEVTIHPREEARLVSLPAAAGDSIADWQLAALPLPADYIGAVAFRTTPTETKIS